jgi:hypothetical protein
MFRVRYLDSEDVVMCEKREGGLVCPHRAICEVYTEDNNKYLCRNHLEDYRDDYEERHPEEVPA